jgi:hypothetical protein
MNSLRVLYAAMTFALTATLCYAFWKDWHVHNAAIAAGVVGGLYLTTGLRRNRQS